MSHKNLNQLKTGPEFISHAEHRGATTRRNGGSHVVVKYDRYSIVVPDHGNKPLGKGLRHVIVKAFIAAGLLGIFVTYVIPNLPR